MVEALFGEAKYTSPNPLTLLQVKVIAPGGSGLPSSEQTPFKVAISPKGGKRLVNTRIDNRRIVIQFVSADVEDKGMRARVAFKISEQVGDQKSLYRYRGSCFGR